MNWIIPIAGKGKRLKSLGDFKPFIKIKNRTIIEWFFIYLKKKIKSGDKLYFVTTYEHEIKNKVELNIKKILKKINLKNNIYIYILDKTPKGPAITVYNILDKLKGIDPCVIINPDQVIDYNLPKKINKGKVYLPIHYNSHGKSSYVNINKKGKINGISEKKLISFYASSGVYIFGSIHLLKNCYRKLKFDKFKKEVNLSDVIDNHLKQSKQLAEPLTTLYKYDLGNITGINYFKSLIESKN